MAAGRLGALLAVAALMAVALSGCQNIRHLPPIFVVDQIRYWWEGDDLIVNVTFHNAANFTPGLTTFEPAITIGPYLETPGEPGGTNGVEFKGGGFSKVFFSPRGPPSAEPWQKRWIHDATTGPIELSPGKTVQVEVLLPLAHQYYGQGGLYVLSVEMESFYPHSQVPKGQGYDESDSFTVGDSTVYYTGCFNHDVPEFYGHKPGGVDCLIWDCTGYTTEEADHQTPRFRTDYNPQGWPDYKPRGWQPHCVASYARGPYD